MVRVLLPRWGMTMTEGTIIRWLKDVGDVVVQGEPLFEVDSDKAVVEAEAPVSGRLTRILAPAGETVNVGAPIAEIEP